MIDMFYVDVSQGRIFLLSYKLRDLMTLLCEDKQSEIVVGCLHFEIDLHDRYVLCRCKSGEDLPAELQAQGSNDTIM